MKCPKNADGTFPTQLTASPIEGSGKAVDAVVDHTLVLRLSQPAPYFLAALTTASADPIPQQIVQSGGLHLVAGQALPAARHRQRPVHMHCMGFTTAT
jgi:hypothetical protein